MVTGLIEKLRAWSHPALEGRSKVAVRVYVDGCLLYRSEKNAVRLDETTPYSAANDLTGLQFGMVRKALKQKARGGMK